MKMMRIVENEIRPASFKECRPLKKGMPEYAVARLKEAYEDDAARGAGYRQIDDKSINVICSAD